MQFPDVAVDNLNKAVNIFRLSAQQVLTGKTVKGASVQCATEMRNTAEEVLQRIVAATDAEIKKILKVKTPFMSQSPTKGSKNKGPSMHDCAVPGYDAETGSFAKVIVLYKFFMTASEKALYLTLRMDRLVITGRDEKKSLAGVASSSGTVSVEATSTAVGAWESESSDSSTDERKSDTKPAAKPKARAKPVFNVVEFLSSDSSSDDDDDVTVPGRKGKHAAAGGKKKAPPSDDDDATPAPAAKKRAKRAPRR